MKKIALLILVPFIFSSCAHLIKWQKNYPDNVAEEFIENLIEHQTDHDIDLTPFTGTERQS